MLWKLLRFFSALMIAGIAMVLASAYLISFNEADVSRDGKSYTPVKIGEFRSLEPLGSFPLSLVLNIKRWSSYEDCVYPSPNSSAIRPKWDAYGSVGAVEVCLFRILNKLGGPEAGLDFFRRYGVSHFLNIKKQYNGNEVNYFSFECYLDSECTIPQRQHPIFDFIFKPYAYGYSLTYRDDSIISVRVTALVL